MGARPTFVLPDHLEARTPPEARGVARDQVKMLVATRHDLALEHALASDLPRILDPGDVVVVNTSATIPGAVDAVDAAGDDLVVHLSTRLDGDRWVVEPRRSDGRSTVRWSGPPPRSPIDLGHGCRLHLVAPYRGARLWTARLASSMAVLPWLRAHARPIRYGYVEGDWPIESYQTVFAREPGSTEMPSAGRPFTPALVTRLVAKGVGVSPVVLHTGVASLEADEVPYPERVKVPVPTAMAVNAARAAGGRVVAVGTTVVRALETAVDDAGTVRPLDGWTDLVVTPERGVRAVDGLLTGWHEPEASHLLLLDAIAGRELLDESYAAALAAGYLWHEFGDVHLVLP